MTKTVEILVYDGMNELDFAAVYDVLTSVEVVMKGTRVPKKGFQVDTVADRISPVETVHGLKLFPHKGAAGSVGANVLIVPGGPGARRPHIPQSVTDWLTRNIEMADLVCAISTGTYILGRAGLIHNRRVTTHKSLVDDLQRLYPRANVVTGVRTTQDGRNMLTSSSSSAGIDLALAIVQRFYGPQIAQYAADRIEYPYRKPVPRTIPPTPGQDED